MHCAREHVIIQVEAEVWNQLFQFSTYFITEATVDAANTAPVKHGAANMLYKCQHLPSTRPFQTHELIDML